MCGIFSYFGTTLTAAELLDAFKLISHRGPDHTVNPFEITRGLWFGFHRLAINGLDSSSNQPLELGDSLYLICNGEIYNHQELADKYHFQKELVSHSDCEAILHMYQKFGIEHTLRELEGVYAFVLADLKTKTIYIARDPIGIRPLFIGQCQDGGEIIVASEAKSIYRFDSFRDSIKQFPAGSFMELGSGLANVKTFKYYDTTQKLGNYLSDPYDTVRALVTHAVKVRALVSDRPVGVFLSGGVDSSLAAAIAKRFIPDLRSFAIGLEGSPDLAAARIAAEAIGTDHTEVTFTVEEGIKELDRLIYHLETPDTTTIRASLPMYLLSKYIKENTDITIVLSGEGPDEVFSGYLYNHNAPSLEELHDEAHFRTRNLCYYDVKRCDRSTSAWSLEVRTPFLCKYLVNYVLNLDPSLRDPKTNKNIEKYLLRAAFAETKILPDSILWRPKEAFSDGVGYNWVSGVKAHAEQVVTNELWAARRTLYPVMTPTTREQFLYRQIYEKYYGKKNGETLIPEIWLPKWSDHGGDPSATVLAVHQSKVQTCLGNVANSIDSSIVKICV